MSLIIAENVGHAFGAQEVFKALNFRVAEGDRIGLVGPNGEGKTTLLRIIAGLLESTAGHVHRRRGLRIGYLPQDPAPFEGSTMHDAMLDVFADLRRIEDEIRALAAAMGDDPAVTERYGALQHEFEARGGYDYHNRIQQVLTGLGFARELWDRPLATLSGGQRTRAFLATLLLQTPDLLLLDEPTNHLDIASTEWLERWLAAFPGALIVVSHDRYLIDHVTSHTWEIAFGELDTYRAPYTKYLTLREARYNERLGEWEAQQEYIRKTEEFIRIHMGSQRTNEAKGRRTRLERFLRDEAVEKPRLHQTISLNLSTRRRTGDLVLVGSGLEIGYKRGTPLLKIESIELVRGQRVAVVGPNGAGKTTLLRTLLGELEPLAGSARRGANVDYGYLSQTHAELDVTATAADIIRAAGPGCTAEQARSLLGSLLLSGDDAFKRIAQLSGGQRSRVALGRLVRLGANVLMLDEPTNHLDIPSTEVIQAALKRFDGTVVFVSHDRYLIEAVATHIWAIEAGELRCFLGGWEKYLEWREQLRTQPAAGTAAGNGPGTQRKGERRKAQATANRLRRRLDQLESEIESLESELATLGAAISSAAEAGQLDALRKLSDRHGEQTARLNSLWAEWDQIGEKIE